MSGLFVTATGTDVGKTYVSAGLIRAARRAGHPVCALKPLLSGYDAGDPAPSDAGQLLDALGLAPTPEAVAAIAPWRFEAPLSPNMAADLEGRTIDLDDVADACRRALAPDHLTLIEGVGGVMVPIDARHTMLDLIARLDLPTLLVGGTGLGALSHCLTALAALRTRRIEPALIVLNETAGSTVPLDATRVTLEAFCAPTPLAILRRDADEASFDALWARVRTL